ncbi:hypothetical protein GGH93_004100 [Coemansia aciculifera]|nr:hypothetical protein GGH93_004100 [Coemansia aciculifera]
MRAWTMHCKLFVIALVLLCLASISLAQNDSDKPDNTTPNSKSSPTPTPDSRTSGSQRPTGTGNNTREKSTATDDEDKSDDNKATNTPRPTTGSDTQDPTPSFDESYDITGIAGSAVMMTPNLMLIPTPMFVIGTNVTIGWKYSNYTLRPPKKISICGKFPKDSKKSKDPAALCDWDIAVNISGTLNKYTWDTLTKSAPGVVFSEDKGYLLYLYDSDFGVRNYLPGAGRITPSQFWFNMYNSRYGSTNDGIQKGYDPSAAHSLSVQLWIVATAVILGVLGIGV